MLKAIAKVPQSHLHSTLLAFSPIGSKFKGCITESTFGLGNQRFGAIAPVNGAALAAILHGLTRRFSDQLINFLLGEIGTALHRDALAAPRRAISSRHLQDPVGIHIKGHLYLGNPARSRGNARQTKPAQ